MNPLAGWAALWAELGLADDPALHAELRHQYASPQRHYHTLHHLAECLGLLEALKDQAERPAEVGIALWFHDAIYEPRRHDNERRSADWAQRALRRAGAEEALQLRIRQLVLATRHDAPAQTADEALIVDIDLAILGAGPSRFDEYERQVREEYRHVPLALYRAVRRRLLQGFLDRPLIYRTQALRTLREVAARENLARSLRQLEGGREPSR